MREDIKNRIEAVRNGQVPEGYGMERAMLYPSDWGQPVPLNTVLSENKDRNENLRFGKDDVLSVSGEQGVVNQIGLLGRSYAGESVAPYHIVETGDVVYTKSPLKENPYGIIKQNRGAPGIVSTLYAVYHCSTPVTGQYLENYFCIDTYLNNYLKPLVKRGAKNDMKVNNEEVLLGRIPLPSLQEQERINEIIDQFDRVIELKQQLLEEKRRKKKWLIQKLLNPNSATVVEKRLGDVCTINDCGIDGLSGDSEIFYIDIAAVDNGEITLPTSPIKLQDAPVRARRTFKCGDILMSTVRPYLHAFAYVDFDTDNYVASTGFSILRVKNGVSSRLIYQLLFTAEMDKQYSSVLVGSNYPALNTSDVEGLVVVIPENYEKQEAVANALEAADRQISLLSSEIDAWQQKKKALMQLLLTGLVRVNA